MHETLFVDAPVAPNPDSQDQTDADLIAAINRGELSAFESLYHRYRDWVLGLACRFTLDSDIALDVKQETFPYLLRKFPGFDLRLIQEIVLVGRFSASLSRNSESISGSCLDQRTQTSGEGGPDAGRKAQARGLSGQRDGFGAPVSVDLQLEIGCAKVGR